MRFDDVLQYLEKGATTAFLLKKVFAKCFHTSGKHANCTKNLINSFVLYMVPLKCFNILDVMMCEKASMH